MSEAGPGGAPREVLEPLRSAPRRTAIVSDIDGTLAPISAAPGDATVPPEAADVLRALAARYALVACLSGRRAVEARRLVGVGELVYVGNHGFESLSPGEESAVLDPAISERAELARGFLHELDGEALERAGLRGEDKGPIQSLHWRGADDEAAAERQAREIAARAERSGLEARWGRKVLELRPVADLDKGSAISRLIRERGVGLALYGGDDVTDLDAFAALRRLLAEGELERAVCVGVASDEEPRGLREGSDLVVDGTSGFLALLDGLA